jgi:hypothetical protein
MLDFRAFANIGTARGDEMSVRISPPTIRKFSFALAVITLALPSLRAFPLPQSQATSDSQPISIAEAARRSRERAKEATKPSKVITDDDLDKHNVKPGAEGLTVDSPPKLETQPPTPGAIAAAETTPSTPPDAATKPAATDDPEITKLKEAIADAERDADLSRRELALNQDTYFSNPDYQHDTAGKEKLDALKQAIDTKQQDIDGMKTRLAALDELHHASQAPAKPAKAPANSPNAPAVAPAP